MRFHSDERGAELNYRVLSETIANVRCGAPLAANWQEEIEADCMSRE